MLEARNQEAATRLEEAVYRGEKVLTEVTSEEFIMCTRSLANIGCDRYNLVVRFQSMARNAFRSKKRCMT